MIALPFGTPILSVVAADVSPCIFYRLKISADSRRRLRIKDTAVAASEAASPSEAQRNRKS
jgi:hypothetical protein